MTWSALLTLDNAKAIGGVFGGGGLAAWMTYRLKNREVRTSGSRFMVESAQSLTETALAVLEPVRTALAETEKKVGDLQKQLRELEQVSARSEAERAALQARFDEVQRRLAETEAERDRLAEALAHHRVDLNGALLPGPDAV